MKVEVHADAEAAARAAAAVIAVEARVAVAARGRFVMAVSGGRTAGLMLRALTAEDVPWAVTHVVQVAEPLAPPGAPERNVTDLRATLLRRSPLPPQHVSAMPVECAAAARYALTLGEVAGAPPVLDLVHLGLGSDGHTAALVLGDPVLDVNDADVALSGIYQGRRWMTLTYPVIDRARCRLWVVTGSAKAEMLARLRDGDRSIPAGRVCQDRALVIADRTAAGDRGPRY
jgi:6-phosphogluconolactonase